MILRRRASGYVGFSMCSTILDECELIKPESLTKDSRKRVLSTETYVRHWFRRWKWQAQRERQINYTSTDLGGNLLRSPEWKWYSHHFLCIRTELINLCTSSCHNSHSESFRVGVLVKTSFLAFAANPLKHSSSYIRFPGKRSYSWSASSCLLFCIAKVKLERKSYSNHCLGEGIQS
jgi:hypothetical protein